MIKCLSFHASLALGKQTVTYGLIFLDEIKTGHTLMTTRIIMDCFGSVKVLSWFISFAQYDEKNDSNYNST